MPKLTTVIRKWTATIEVDFEVTHAADESAQDWELDAEEAADEIADDLLSNVHGEAFAHVMKVRVRRP